MTNPIFVDIPHGAWKKVASGTFGGDGNYPNKPPAGIYSYRVRRTWAGQDKSGVVIRLDESTGDKLEVLVQDDLTSLDTLSIKVQGHEVQD